MHWCFFFFKITTTGPVRAGRAVRRKVLQRPEMVPSLLKSTPAGASRTHLTIHTATQKSATKLVTPFLIYRKRGRTTQF